MFNASSNLSSRTKTRLALSAAFLVLAIVLVLIPNLYPINQFFKHSGLLFYANAFDEPQYLSFYGSLATQSPIRISQYLITFLHHIGFSGGWINLLLDTVIVIALTFTGFAIFRILGMSRGHSVISILLIFSAPLLFGYANSYSGAYFNYVVAKGWYSFITAPQAFYPPFYRSPEPQVSWMILSLAVYLSLRYKRYFITALALPVLYVFVSIPSYFVLTSIVFNDKIYRKLLPNNTTRFLLSSFSAYLVTSFILLAVSFAVKGNPAFGPVFVPTQLPIISTMSVVNLVLVGILWRSIPDQYRFFAFSSAVACLAVANHQLISGFIIQPNNFEQYYGVVATGVILSLACLGLGRKYLLYPLVLIFSVYLMIRFNSNIENSNNHAFKDSPIPEKMLTILKTDSLHFVINERHLSGLLGMLYSKQRPLAFAQSRTIVLTAEKYIASYRCLKGLIIARPGLKSLFQSDLQSMDSGFKYLGFDFFLLNLNRRQVFPVFYDTLPQVTDCPSDPYYYYPKVSEIEGSGRSMDVTKFRKFGTAQVVVSPGGALIVTTSTIGWDYAVAFELSPGRHGNENDHQFQIAARVIKGCLGFSLIKGDWKAISQESYLREEAGEQQAVISVGLIGGYKNLMVRNCNEGGESKVIIESIRASRVQHAVGVIEPRETQQ